MIAKAIGVLGLLLGPSAALYAVGYDNAAHGFALGTVLAVQMCVLARPVAGFSMLLPVIYAAAAITAQSTDGVAALIIAAAALVGVASSQGFQRGVLAVLAATLIGASQPAAPIATIVPIMVMEAGSVYGLLIALTLLRDVEINKRAVRPQTALSYAALLAVLVTVAWLAARAFGLQHGWWVPLAIASVGQPALEGSVRRSLLLLAGALLSTLLLVAAFEIGDSVVAHAVLLAITGLMALLVGPQRRWLRALLVTPLLVLIVGHTGDHTAAEYLRSAAMACAAVFAFALLGQWLLWTIRPDPGRVAA